MGCDRAPSKNIHYGISAMQSKLRNVLDTAYERLSRAEQSPPAFASNYALCLGVIMGGVLCEGMTDDEAATERAHLSMLAVVYEAQLGVRSGLNLG
jgi:hypothetical protein